MRLKEYQTGYVATKIGIDLSNAPFITMPKGKDSVVGAVKDIIDINFKLERALDEKVYTILDDNDEPSNLQKLFDTLNWLFNKASQVEIIRNN